AGIRKVVSREEYLNKINVFPVPDSDTGTNMAYTLTTIEESIHSQVHSNIQDMMAVVADAALDGARGNSGAILAQFILAQFLVGFSEGIRGKMHLNVKQFSEAVQTAKSFAYQALVQPQEGTILTVLAEWADHIQSLSHKIADFQEVLEQALNRARTALEDTPRKLEVLAKAGVVDAGAQGFVDLLEGIQKYIEQGILEAQSKMSTVIAKTAGKSHSTKYQFCTECLILGEKINRPELMAHLNEIGDSIVIAGTKTKAKVHLHTNDPKGAFQICGRYGQVTGEKVDDMLKQQKDAHEKQAAIALVVDSTSDLPEDIIDRYNIHVIPVRLNFGEHHYVDRVTLSIEEFWKELQSNPHHPQTSQPSPGDFRRQYQFLSTHYDSAISIHLPQILSGTYQSAQVAGQSLPHFPIGLFDGNSLSLGIGLITLRAAEAIEAGKSFDDVINVVRKAIESTSIYFLLDTLEYVVRGGRLPRSKQRIADLLHLNPILTVSPEGSLVPAGKLWGRRNRVERIYRFLKKQIPAGSSYRVGIIHADCPDDAEALRVLFLNDLPDDQLFVSTIGPALGVHAGPGVIGAAIQIWEDK
ncbi:MAG: DegV family EDD domain-containing protein, partial [FCB group bacterium]|nr:DegV family EDD domain-containing protein [FCB group bacterium]